MKWKVFIPDNPKIMGGWDKVATIEAENEAAAKEAAKKYGPVTMVKEIKQ